NRIETTCVFVPLILLVLFNKAAELPLERNIIRYLKTADAGMAVTVQRHGIHTGIGAVKPRERRFRRPGIADIILAAGAKGGREAFSVHKEFFISFAPPPVHALFIPLAIPPAFGRFFRSRPLVENMHMYATETSCCAANHQQRPIRPAV